MQTNATPAPRIGVALGSGSARGWAHIGVLRALERAGAAPTIVSGTSVGALVGAFYAAGQLDALEQWVRKLTRRDMLSMVDFNVSGGGFIEGRRLHRFYTERLAGAQIEDQQVSFGAVATTLRRGTEVWFREGLLADAVRASTALPGLFRPVAGRDDWLVDGGLVNPVPVSLCRAMGAEVVIAVNLNGDLVGRHLRKHAAAEGEGVDGDDGWLRHIPDGLRERASEWFSWIEDRPIHGRGPAAPGILEVVASSLNIMQDRITRSRMAGDPPDILCSPRLSHIGLLEYHRADEAIGIGAEVVDAVSTQLDDVLGRD